VDVAQGSAPRPLDSGPGWGFPWPCAALPGPRRGDGPDGHPPPPALAPLGSPYDKAAESQVEALFAEELAARQAIREQFESAYGRLRDLYCCSCPALAERFFLREGPRRRTAKPS
jgi:hypothetical protein